MPLYNYKCEGCGEKFTTLEKLNSTIQPPCPKCGSGETTKQVTAPSGFEFKGGGFYVTDFKDKK
jgi:putative FmdB family regulatory protein